MKKEQEGTITVFLSLTFLLVLAVVMTTIESARVSAAKAGSERTLITAMDSILAEFYSPLYDEYHIFGLDSSYGTGTMDTNIMVEKLEGYMEYTFDPGKDISLPLDLPLDYFNLYGIKTKGLQVNKVTTLMDYEGKAFVNQATSYMKYKAIGDNLESFMGNTTDMEEADNSQAILEEKEDTEESLYEMDKDILELMRLVDGININESGIKLDKNQNIKILDNFVKKICPYAATQANLSIQNDLVYNSLKGHYVNPFDTINTAENIVRNLYANSENKEAALMTYNNLSSVDESQIKDPDKLEEHKKALSEAESNCNKYEREEENLIKELKSNITATSELAKGTLSVTKNALRVIDDLVNKQVAATKKITDYENTLEENKANLNEDFYKGLLDDLKSMEKYKSIGSNTINTDENVEHYDFTGMKETLLKNQEILNNVITETNISITSDKNSWAEAKSHFISIKSSIKNYSHDNLYFDYSSITKPIESDSFFQGVKSIMEDGILSLVMEDMDSVSDKKISESDLPTTLHETEEDKDSSDISGIFSSIGLNADNSLSDVFDSFGNNFDFTQTALKGGDIIGEFLLFQEYLTTNFESYNKEKAENTLKSLDYELEYILMGNSSDYDNLKAILTKILLIRTVMNLITLISDSKSSGEARVLAAGFVGFTGLPALVEITKMIILTVWAFAESLVDVTALLQGKSVPFIKTGSGLQTQLYDIFTLSKLMIQSKADKMQEKGTTYSLRYKDYLKIFLFMESEEKKSYRAMDLIQENIQNKYEDTFLIKNCVIGFQTEATFSMNSKFVSLPFVADLLNQDTSAGYEFNTVKEYAY